MLGLGNSSRNDNGNRGGGKQQQQQRGQRRRQILPKRGTSTSFLMFVLFVFLVGTVFKQMKQLYTMFLPITTNNDEIMSSISTMYQEVLVKEEEEKVPRNNSTSSSNISNHVSNINNNQSEKAEQLKTTTKTITDPGNTFAKFQEESETHSKKGIPSTTRTATESSAVVGYPTNNGDSSSSSPSFTPGAKVVSPSSLQLKTDPWVEQTDNTTIAHAPPSPSPKFLPDTSVTTASMDSKINNHRKKHIERENIVPTASTKTSPSSHLRSRSLPPRSNSSFSSLLPTTTIATTPSTSTLSPTGSEICNLTVTRGNRIRSNLFPNHTFTRNRVEFSSEPSRYNITQLFKANYGIDGQRVTKLFGTGMDEVEYTDHNNNNNNIVWLAPNPDFNNNNSTRTPNKVQLQVVNATCHFDTEGSWSHMAHASQQLFRCFSWWKAHPNLPKVLIWPKMPKQGLNKYLVGLKQALVDTFNVTIVQQSNGEPRVSALMAHTTRSSLHPHFAMCDGPEDVTYFRNSILEQYDLTDNDRSRAAGCYVGKTTPIIGIINREKDRKIFNVYELADRLVTELSLQQQQQQQESIEIMYFENRTFLEQLQYMSQIDILLTSHGAQLVSIPFMPKCGGVMEFFQRHYYIPYYFGSLASMSGLNHAYLYTGGNPKNDLKQVQKAKRPGLARQEARVGNICLDIDYVLEGIRTMIKQWRTCCNG